MTIMQIAALVVAYLLSFARLFDAARWAWAWIPTKFQPLAPAVLAAIPALADAFRGVTNRTELTIAIMGALGTLTTSVRGALPAAHFEKLDADGKEALAVARGTKKKDDDAGPPTPPTGTPIPPLAAASLMAFVLFMGCSAAPLKPPCDDATAAQVAAVCAFRVQSECVDRGVAEADCEVIKECDEKADKRKAECLK